MRTLLFRGPANADQEMRPSMSVLPSCEATFDALRVSEKSADINLRELYHLILALHRRCQGTVNQTLVGDTSNRADPQNQREILTV